jgi:hypothetical protein
MKVGERETVTVRVRVSVHRGSRLMVGSQREAPWAGAMVRDVELGVSGVEWL